jgi:hypothetical protein
MAGDSAFLAFLGVIVALVAITNAGQSHRLDDIEKRLDSCQCPQGVDLDALEK